MDTSSTSILIVTGPVGVGKTSVADEIFEIMQGKSEHVALINIDELGYISPRPEDDPYNQAIRLKNLAAVWANYANLGTSLAIIPAVIETAAELELYKKAIPHANFFVVCLTAPLAVLEERIKNRQLGGSEAWHLKRAAELVDVLASNHIENTAIRTEGKGITEVAEAVLAAWRRNLSL